MVDSGVELVIRPLQVRDLDAILAIDAESFATLWPRSLLEAEIELEGRHHLVAELDGVVAGHGSFMHVEDEATLTTLAVAPHLRNSGIASAVLLALLSDAIARQTTAVTLEVRASNESAQSLYRRFGFDIEGRRKRYYEPDGEDAVIMWLRHLQSSAVTDRLATLEQSLAWSTDSGAQKG